MTGRGDVRNSSAVTISWLTTNVTPLETILGFGLGYHAQILTRGRVCRTLNSVQQWFSYVSCKIWACLNSTPNFFSAVGQSYGSKTCNYRPTAGIDLNKTTGYHINLQEVLCATHSCVAVWWSYVGLCVASLLASAICWLLLSAVLVSAHVWTRTREPLAVQVLFCPGKTYLVLNN